MGNPFKKKLNRLMGKDNHSKGWQQGQTNYFNAQGQNAARSAELDAAMKEYDDVPGMIRKQYTEAAQRAGTYAPTAEFGAGLESEVVAGSRGARVGIAGRINALKKALGHTDEFKPEGLGETQANTTKAALTDKPMPVDTEGSAPSQAASPAEEAPEAPTAAQKLQNSTGTLARKLSTLRSFNRG